MPPCDNHHRRLRQQLEGGPGVAWRDEMNALDSDVAAGRITAEEYRTKRDELLAGSGSGAAGGPNPFPPPPTGCR